MLKIIIFLIPKSLDNCDRGQISCGNGLGENQNCCNDRNCDLDRIKSLPWEDSLGINHACYQRCDQNKCYSTSKFLKFQNRTCVLIGFYTTKFFIVISISINL